MRTSFQYRGAQYRASVPNDVSRNGYNAAKVFLQRQPEIQTASVTSEDFERLWDAISVSFRTDPLNQPSEHLYKLSSTRIYLNALGTRLTWSRSGIAQRDFFPATWALIRRKHLARCQPTHAAARDLLNQSPDIQLHCVEYLNQPWFCFVPNTMASFFEDMVRTLSATVCFREQCWLQTEFEVFWVSVQTTCASGMSSFDWRQTYNAFRWRRSIPSTQLVQTAELLHFLHRKPLMQPTAFLHAFDACLPHPAQLWPFYSQAPQERHDLLAQACALTGRELHPYPLPIDSQDARQTRLQDASVAWPNAVSPEAMMQRLQSYRQGFVTKLEVPVICSLCACPNSSATATPLNLRELPGGCTSVHKLLSAQAYVDRHRSCYPNDLPETFQGLSLEDLQPFCAQLPVELRHLSPVPRPVLFYVLRVLFE